MLSNANVLDMTNDESCSVNFDYEHAVMLMTCHEVFFTNDMQTSHTTSGMVSACMRHINMQNRLILATALIKFVSKSTLLYKGSYKK